ncbi:MAG TPA: ATP-binding cassette domain-containing protein [Thermoanaerobaculia bacterium]|nr:ATP-binding cassette domain-containing protein [Thermoanaerobaculia bacterium]
MSIVVEGLTKRFGGRSVVDHVSLEIADGELFVLLGSSGSGKSTVLRMVAGLASSDEGRILLVGRDVTDLPPQQRGVGLVFQNYSVFQHMTVAKNIAFGLRIRGVRRKERRRKSEELLDLVGLGGLGDRYARQLSGGQQQRVALARALAYEPKVLLLDEPFGALDVKIRSQVRRSFRAIQQRLKVTTILVTHDQEEAFEMADRIGVIERGRLVEVGLPEQLYSSPTSLTTATFLGAGTVLVGRCRDGQAEFGSLRLPVPEEVPHGEGAPVRVLIRPEQVLLGEESPADLPTLGRGRVIESNFVGALRRVRLRAERLPRTRQVSPPLPFGEEGLLVEAALSAALPVPEEAWIGLSGWRILKQPRPRLLVADPIRGKKPPVEMARRLAAAIDGNLIVLGVVGATKPPDPLRQVLQSRFEAEAADVRVRSGNPAEQLRDEQAEGFYDLVVIGEPGRKAIKSGVLQRLLTQISTPTLVGALRKDRFERVLICTAVGEPGKSDVRVGGWLAGRLGARVTLLHVSRGPGPPPRWISAHLEQGIKTLSAFDVTAEARVRDAPSPLAGIREEAREGDYDLVVIGGHGPRSRLIAARDDVTLRVLEQADRPVLVVPAESG